jgi:Na+/proline symporter
LSREVTIVAGVVAYLAAVLAIGAWASVRTRGGRDFWVAGQRVGLLPAGLATMSAAFSGFVFVGGPGLTYRAGLFSLWIVLPVAFTAPLLCWIVGGRLRELAGAGEVWTVPDAVALRYRSRLAGGLAAAAVLAGTLGYLGAQLLALGILLRSALGFEGLAPAMAIGVAVLVAYSTFGGMMAGVYTDVLQGALMVLAAVAVFARAVAAAGGWRGMTASIEASPLFGPGFLDPLGDGGTFAAFGLFFVFGVGVLGQPHVLHKFYMLRDARTLRWLPAVLGGSQVACLLIWVGLGLAVPALVAQGAMEPLGNPDDAAGAFLREIATPGLAALAMAAVLAAIMSTADSFLNVGAAALVRDLPRALGRPLARELGWARAAVPVVACGAGLLAWSYGDLVAILGTFAFGTFAAALAPAVAIGLNWDGVTPRAACWSIGVGLVASLGLEVTARVGLLEQWLGGRVDPGFPPSAWALAASFAVLLGVSLADADR